MVHSKSSSRAINRTLGASSWASPRSLRKEQLRIFLAAKLTLPTAFWSPSGHGPLVLGTNSWVSQASRTCDAPLI